MGRPSNSAAPSTMFYGHLPRDFDEHPDDVIEAVVESMGLDVSDALCELQAAACFQRRPEGVAVPHPSPSVSYRRALCDVQCDAGTCSPQLVGEFWVSSPDGPRESCDLDCNVLGCFVYTKHL